jgi:hypothetical protein
MIVFHYPEWIVKSCYDYLTDNFLVLGDDYRWSHDHDSGNLAIEIQDDSKELFYYMKLSKHVGGITWKKP